MDMEEKFGKMRSVTQEMASAIDGGREWEEKKWNVEEGSFNISIIRGESVQKASIGRIRLSVDKKITGPGNEVVNPMKLNSCQLNVYPSNPLLPVAYLNLENRVIEDESDTLGGYLSIFPMKDEGEIINPLRDIVDSKISQYGKDKNEVMRAYDAMWQDLDWEFKGEKGIGMKIKADKDDAEFVFDMLLSLLEGFFDCLSKFNDRHFNAEDEERMYLFRYRITEFIILKDASSKFVFGKGLPLETISSMILPPVVKL